MSEKHKLVPDVLSWSPELLWARYLDVMREYGEDVDRAYRPKLSVHMSMEGLVEELREVETEEAALDWSVLLLWGYRTYRTWYKACLEESSRPRVHTRS